MFQGKAVFEGVFLDDMNINNPVILYLEWHYKTAKLCNSYDKVQACATQLKFCYSIWI